MNLIRFLFIILSIVLILLLNKYLFLPDFNQVCEYALCCSLNIPVKSNYSKDKFYHVIDKDQLELFSKNIQDVLVGSLLGDGCISKAGRGPVHFRFKQSVIHAEYFFFMYFILENYITPGSPGFSQFFDKRYEQTYSSLLLLTNAVSKDILNLDYLKDLFYKWDVDKQKSIKIIPHNIADLLSPIALAFWICDDGHFYHNGVFLNTQSFGEDGVKFLMEALKLKLNIEPKISKVSKKSQQFRIFIPSKDLELVKSLVLPHMCKSMHYKLGVK